MNPTNILHDESTKYFGYFVLIIIGLFLLVLLIIDRVQAYNNSKDAERIVKKFFAKYRKELKSIPEDYWANVDMSEKPFVSDKLEKHKRLFGFKLPFHADKI